MTAPDDCFIAWAERVVARSPCEKGKRGVVLYVPRTGASRGEGFNGPPGLLPCPGRAHCGDDCNKRCVHAEMRALRSVVSRGEPLDLVHIKLGADGHVTPGGPPSCWQCSREILDVGFVGGVWLYEQPYIDIVDPDPKWRRYTAEEFHAATLRNCGIV